MNSIKNVYEMFLLLLEYSDFTKLLEMHMPHAPALLIKHTWYSDQRKTQLLKHLQKHSFFHVGDERTSFCLFCDISLLSNICTLAMVTVLSDANSVV